jgi:hypothetical protein
VWGGVELMGGDQDQKNCQCNEGGMWGCGRGGFKKQVSVTMLGKFIGGE